MNKTLKESREMKDSGIEWIGQIPKTWEVIPNKYVMKKIKDICIRYDNEDILSLTMNGVIIRDLDNPTGKMPTTFDGYQRLSKGNLLMCLFDIDVTPRCIGLINNNGLTSPAYSQFTLKNGNIAKYYYYYYLNLDFTKELLHLSKNLRNSLTENLLGAVKVPVPPIHEQRAIANYLDEQVKKIDELIVEQNQAIENWKTYRQSLITETVTKGLNCHVEMKDSGIDWIGEIPSDWGVRPLRKIVSLRNEKNIMTKNDIYVGLENIQGFNAKYIRTETVYDEGVNNVFRSGDVLFSKLRPYLTKALIPDFDGFCTGELIVFSKYSGVKRYLLYLLLSNKFIDIVNSSTYGTKMPRANWDFIGNLHTPFPPLHEQQQIADFLDEKCLKIDQTIEQKQALIKQLEEYKQSLIYECVTGKRCVL